MCATVTVRYSRGNSVAVSLGSGYPPPPLELEGPAAALLADGTAAFCLGGCWCCLAVLPSQAQPVIASRQRRVSGGGCCCCWDLRSNGVINNIQTSLTSRGGSGAGRLAAAARGARTA